MGRYLRKAALKYLIDLISVLPPSRYDLRRNNKGILAPKVILNRNLGHLYSARHFVGTISLYLDFYILFLQITFLVTNCKKCSFRL